MTMEKKDIDQLEKIGISPANFERQIELITKGMDSVKLVSAATIGHGIIQVKHENIQRYLNKYVHSNERLEILKFVPASGAATRMFKDLILFYNEKKHNPGSEMFFDQIEKFPFYKKLKQALPDEIERCNKDLSSQWRVAAELLYNGSFDYSSLPKGMIEFHEIDNEMRTAFEEHFREAVNHSGENKNVGLHFTVPLSHRDAIKELMNKVKKRLGQDAITLNHDRLV